MKYSWTLMILFFLFLGNAQSVKLMTYNIRLDIESDGENKWSNRKEFLTSQLHFYEPDIFGVQEAKPNQVIDIAAALSQYNVIGIGRDGVNQGESSNIYYKKKRFKVVQNSTFWLSETPDKISKGWDAAFNRVCTYALFKDLKTKTSFWVFNTHLDHMGELARTNGIQLILSKIASLNTKKYPVIFMGDFNSKPKEERIISLKKEMLDTREISREKPFGPTGTFNDFKHNEPVTECIDYIFISKNSNFKVWKYAILSDSKDLKYPSDHLPVYVELVVTKYKI
ncbi:endonuclease/exonuclease/phosphatase family protein [Flavobacterium franklandianum]|uniref:Endonuclease/exonuclease/phosphatase family protein n=1 Tax=Flavobacterium franklandianum TaxID=2594430 RepID=A0A553CL54_9FLAO|nr:endonuclease/exonuclease/phosphatase family protein [Flavobacterium franklandianum]TRX21252.1 endonuclease/exonuclease/phosphatase family protein [Flavobacterium franklandianum]TRX30098.1 endonuclease/exonuclease/phosphatase family protein [Flavobacterium franklandianum]